MIFLSIGFARIARNFSCGKFLQEFPKKILKFLSPLSWKFPNFIFFENYFGFCTRVSDDFLHEFCGPWLLFHRSYGGKRAVEEARFEDLGQFSQDGRWWRRWF